MIKSHPQVCLFKPEIPQNTGNVGRLCAATQSRLHLITPFGFSPSDKNLRRAGLDYWPYLDVEIHHDAEKLFARYNSTQIAFFSKFATKSYLEMPDEVELIVFGQETKGLPEELREKYKDSLYALPMYHPKVRSFNLANSVAIATHHLLARK
jgi:tRNA (cytidine/uridine-2'-O-)-methyltransferase